MGGPSSIRFATWYNLTITSASIGVALLIGVVEVLGLLSARLSLNGSFWAAIAALNGGFGYLGFGRGRPLRAVLGQLARRHRWRGYDRL